MHNPLQLLFKEALEELLLQNHVYFVRQSYQSGMVVGAIGAFLFTPYKNREDAQQHFDAIYYDHRRLIYDASDPGQLDKLYIAACQPEGYYVYIDRLRGRVWKPCAELGMKIEVYIRRYTNWKAGRGDIRAAIGLQFGQLIIKLQKGQEELKVPLRDIEKL